MIGTHYQRQFTLRNAKIGKPFRERSDKIDAAAGGQPGVQIF